jgi:hypothetical protein
MGVLYDLVVPFVDSGASFGLRWRNGLDVAISQSFGCIPDRERHLGELFDSDGGSRSRSISESGFGGGIDMVATSLRCICSKHPEVTRVKPITITYLCMEFGQFITPQRPWRVDTQVSLRVYDRHYDC